MTDLERLLDAIPTLKGIGAQTPYLRLHWGSGDASEAAVDADVELLDDPDQGSRLAVAVTEWLGGTRLPVRAAVFCIETGALTVYGPTISRARPVQSGDAESVVQTLIASLKDLAALPQEAVE